MTRRLTNKKKNGKLTTNQTSGEQARIHRKQTSHLPMSLIQVSAELGGMLVGRVADEAHPAFDGLPSPGSEEIRI